MIRSFLPLGITTRRLLAYQSRKRRLFYTPSFDSEAKINEATEQALQLLKYERFNKEQIREAHHVLTTLNQCKAKSPESINASFRLLAFLNREGYPGDHFNGLLHRWRSAKMFGQPVMNPKQIFKALRGFKHDVRSLGILASVQAWMAPLELKHVALEIYMDGIETRRDLKPDRYMFQQLLRAWMISGNDDTAECLFGLHARLEQAKLDPLAPEYYYMLRFWANRWGENEVGATLQRMSIFQVKPNVQCFSAAIQCYSEYGVPWRAEFLIRDMIKKYPKCRWKITWCAVRMIKGYTHTLERRRAKHRQEPDKAVEELTAHVLEKCQGDHGLEAKIQSAYMDYWTAAGVCSKALETFPKIQRPSIESYCSLIRAYGKDDNIVAAMQVLQHKMPRRPMEAYRAGLDAFLWSSKKDTPKYVRKLWKQMKEEGVEPLADDCQLYLEVLSKYRGQSVHVEHIIDEMKEKGLEVGRYVYHYAIQACAISRDYRRCRALLLRMSEDGIYPTEDTYSDSILPHIDPRRAEEVVAKMRGSILTCDAYHSLMITWMRRSSRQSPRKVYSLYETMLGRGIKPDNETYSIMISYFAKRDLATCEKLLDDLENNHGIDSDYSHYNPIMDEYLRRKEPRRAAVILLRRADAFLGQRYPATLDSEPLPENIHAVLVGHCEAGDLAAATWLLVKLHRMPLTLFKDSYDMMMDAWRVSGSKDSETQVRRIKALLKNVEMDEKVREYTSNPVKPNYDPNDALGKAIENRDFKDLFN